MASRPRLFIGSSSEGKKVANLLQLRLDGDACAVDVWDQGLFIPTRSTLSDLLRIASGIDFAVLVVTPDDVLEQRGTTGPVPRDNVLLELGIFLGALGAERTFIVFPRGTDIKMPSDLAGITQIPYTQREPPDQGMVGGAATQILERIEAVGARERIDEPQPSLSSDPLRFASDLVTRATTGAAGVSVQVHDDAARGEWIGGALAMLVELFLDRSPDVYAVWLAPEPGNETLRVAMSRNLPPTYDHPTFRKGEGLVGNVWARGVSAARAPSKPHEWWVFREGCENQTYVCSPLGGATGVDGVLAIGSDTGFDLENHDVEIVHLFAAICGAAMTQSTGEKEKALLRSRVAVLDGPLAAYPASRQASSGEVNLHNTLLELAKQVVPCDLIISSLQALPADGSTDCGAIRLSLAQIEAGLSQ